MRSEEIGSYVENDYKLSPLFEAIKVTLAYGFLGELWILFSDNIALNIAGNLEIYQEIQTYKGGIYVFLTMLLVFFLAFSRMRLFRIALVEIASKNNELNDKNQRLVALEEELRQQLDELEENRRLIALNEERLEQAVEGSGCGIWDWDLKTNVCYFSPKWKSLLGYSDSEILNAFESWEALLHPDDREEALEKQKTYVNSKTGSYENVFRMQCKDGGFIWIQCRAKAIRDIDGKVIRVAGTHTDITNEKLLENKLHSLAYYDTLTGLPNRFFFENKVNSLICKANKLNKKFALLYMDIDNFKNINDSLGHASGDLLIKYIANLLEQKLGASDFVARLGGDEFAIILDETDQRVDIEAKIQGLLSPLRAPWVIDNHEFFISTSIGIAIYPEHGEDLSVLLKSADIAMYFVKKQSKDNYCFYSSELQDEMIERITLINYLRHAVDYDEFHLLYQPVVNLKDGSLIGAEALIRWTHPERGFISPAGFIPLAEENGVINEIEKWVLKTAMLQKKYWQEKNYPNIKISINISGKSLTDVEIVGKIKELLSKTRLEAKDIQLEVTETAVMKDLDMSIKVLKEIKEMGIEIALDDFGTGYSSLTYLKKLPIDIVKLDINFIRNITEVNNDRFIVEHMIRLIHDMNLKVVAEGIEEEEQLNLLKEMACDYGQGYFFSRPLKKEDFEKYMSIEDQ